MKSNKSEKNKTMGAILSDLRKRTAFLKFKLHNGAEFPKAQFLITKQVRRFRRWIC